MILTDGYTTALKHCGCLACRLELARLAARRARPSHQPVHLEGEPIVPARGNPTYNAVGTGRTHARRASQYR